MQVVDLRSDTKTRPTPEMRYAMSVAEVGDDMAGEDPTVNRLEEIAAKMLGTEAALLVSSGTQANLVSILAQCGRGGEVIAGDMSHIMCYELGGASVLGGAVMTKIPNDNRGMIDPNQLESLIHVGNRSFPNTKLVALENTHNTAGGTILTPTDMATIAEVTIAHDVSLHLDGARVFNAAVALEIPVSELTKHVQSVSFCLSKGLGAPVGSLLCASQETIDDARRWRKILGSAMRQAGVIAAAGVVALETMVDRLSTDHANAKRLAIGLNQIREIDINPEALPTNLIFCNVNVSNEYELIDKIDQRGIKILARGEGQWRMVTHNDVTARDIDYVLEIITTVFRDFARS